MKHTVPRTCTEVSTGAFVHGDPRPLEQYRETPAYVLLGDPGSGKTTAFQEEVEALGDEALLIDARDFLAFSPENHPEWRNKTLFIDGLDEVRAGQSDARTSLEAVRGRIDAMGKPAFRLSCRSADWLGATDRSRLEAVSPNGEVTVLNLDPLGESEVTRIVSSHPEISSPEAFVKEARKRGVGGLLPNPQNLELLVRSVAGGGNWPDGRRETFEGACSQMAAEHNTEHLSVHQLGTVGQLLDAAGRLCLVQVVAGVSGYASRQRQSDEEYIEPNRCGYEDIELLRHVLSTKLFSADGAGAVKPVHRHLAEFVGARHLARLIEGGLPAKRVIALMTGEDGLVVSELRGLSAWLAAVCRPARQALIHLDAIGVGLYGDIRDFSLEEKHALLGSLMGRVSSLNPYSTARAFASLAVPETASAMREMLSEPDRSTERQSFAVFLLLTLKCGQPIRELSGFLLDLVRDQTWRSDVRQAALEAFVHCCQDSVDRTRELGEFLRSVHEGKLEDPENELLGSILSHAYPQDISPSEVWNYLYERGSPRLIGRYQVFWRRLLLQKSSDDQIVKLLDSLSARMSELRPALEHQNLHELPLELLERGLTAQGELMEAGDLYDWLSAGTKLQQILRKRAPNENIRVWLEQRPHIQKAVVAAGLSRCPETDRFMVYALDVYECLYGSELPSDFGLWCLNEAEAIADTKPMAAEHLLQQAVAAHRTKRHHRGLSVQVLQDLTTHHENLRSKLQALLEPPAPSPIDDYERKNREFREKRRREESEWVNHVRSQEQALIENRAAPLLLFELAESYLGGTDNVGGGPAVAAIERLLQDDQRLVAAALQGLCGVIERSDVPDIEEVLQLREESRMFYLSLPFLVGMAELDRNEPERLYRLDDAQITRALAFYFSTPRGGHSPDWYLRVLKERPEIVADVLASFAIADFKGGRDYVEGLWQLAYEPDHARVARMVSLPLLRTFPARSRLKQIESLEHLLLAAIQHSDRESLAQLIDEKCRLKSMDVAQRARWLAAGLITSPGAYLESTGDFAANSERRIRHLIALFQTRISIDLDLRVSTLLIRLAGASYAPDRLFTRRDEAQWVTPDMEGSDLVWDLISRFSASPERAASEALDALAADDALRLWTPVISRARESQQVVRRDASYRHPTVEQVCATLAGSTPANAGDLAALLMYRLDETARQIRTTNTDDWLQYWNEDAYGRPMTPKHEDHCRDALLSDLRRLLPAGVDAQPEGQYAKDLRADIRVAGPSGFHVPVEVKKNMHRDLWRAMRDQLISGYASDPATSGFGIYLVFWFGPGSTPPDPSGKRPDGPDELKDMLRATLSPDHKRKISVCVIDVSADR